jgi:RNA polymerase sigma-70 factor (ECF subfamily)
MREMNERKIINLIRNGEHDAYRHLIERYQVGLIIHCDQLLHDRDIAEDIAQEAFVRAYYSINRFDDTKGSYSTWLYRIATNMVKDYHKKAHREQPLPDYDIAAKAEGISSSEAMEVRRVVDELEPPEYATVIRAYYWEGKRYETIAEELGVPIATVGTWIKRAKVKLRKELV